MKTAGCSSPPRMPLWTPCAPWWRMSSGSCCSWCSPCGASPAPSTSSSERTSSNSRSVCIDEEKKMKKRLHLSALSRDIMRSPVTYQAAQTSVSIDAATCLLCLPCHQPGSTAVHIRPWGRTCVFGVSTSSSTRSVSIAAATRLACFAWSSAWQCGRAAAVSGQAVWLTSSSIRSGSVVDQL